MTNTTTTKDKQAQAETQQITNSQNKDTQLLNVRPLPQNRPIATNESEGIDALLGYLD